MRIECVRVKPLQPPTLSEMAIDSGVEAEEFGFKSRERVWPNPDGRVSVA